MILEIICMPIPLLTARVPNVCLLEWNPPDFSIPALALIVFKFLLAYAVADDILVSSISALENGGWIWG